MAKVSLTQGAFTSPRLPLSLIPSLMEGGGVLKKLVVVVTNTKDYRFTAKMVADIDNNGTVQADSVYQIVDEAGKVKNFGDADDVLRAVRGVAPAIPQNLAVEVENGSVLTRVESLVIGDPIDRATRDRARLQANSAKITVAKDKVNATLGLIGAWATGTPAQQLAHAEYVAQFTVLGVSLDYHTAEIARLDAIISGAN
jgi:hypothetical protein